MQSLQAAAAKEAAVSRSSLEAEQSNLASGLVRDQDSSLTYSG